MHTDKSEETGMSLHVRSAGSFHGFRVSRRDMSYCIESFSRNPPLRFRADVGYYAKGPYSIGAAGNEKAGIPKGTMACISKQAVSDDKLLFHR